MKEPIWLQKNVVIATHEMLLAEHGGPAGMRDEGLLDSALGRPLNLFHYEEATIYELGAAYAIGISKNHPFVDGNKRSAFMAMNIFLERNGLSLKYGRQEAIETFFALAAGDILDADLCKIIKRWAGA